MKNTIVVKFTVRNRGGSLGGKTIEREATDFDWEAFKNCPNAAEFAQKVYFQAVRRIAREEEQHSTTTSALQTMENVLTNSLSYTRDEILEWISSRDWDSANLKLPAEQAIDILKRKLTRISGVSGAESNRLAEIIASVADKPDPVAEYLFSRLTMMSRRIEASDL
ncbi:hypothetical protein D3C78_758190 [compost metagenome]